MLASTTPASSSSEAAAKVISDQFINRTVLVHIPDGRTFRGTFFCIDDGMNVILTNTDEIRRQHTSNGSNPVEDAAIEKVTERNVGMVMIPGKFVQKVEVEESPVSASAPPAPSVGPMGWPDDPEMYS